MKYFAAIILTLTILSTAFTSCTKDDSTDPKTNYVSAKIDGVTYSADSIVAVVAAGQMSFTSVVGIEKIILYIPENASTGNHAINFSTYNILYFDRTGAIYTAQSGSINIGKYDASGKAIEGSFSAQLYNGAATPSITDGVFNIQF